MRTETQSDVCTDSVEHVVFVLVADSLVLVSSWATLFGVVIIIVVGTANTLTSSGWMCVARTRCFFMMWIHFNWDLLLYSQHSAAHNSRSWRSFITDVDLLMEIFKLYLIKFLQIDSVNCRGLNGKWCDCVRTLTNECFRFDCAAMLMGHRTPLGSDVMSSVWVFVQNGMVPVFPYCVYVKLSVYWWRGWGWWWTTVTALMTTIMLTIMTDTMYHERYVNINNKLTESCARKAEAISWIIEKVEDYSIGQLRVGRWILFSFHHRRNGKVQDLFMIFLRFFLFFFDHLFE